MWKGKRVVLGITGGIAAYKAAELTREIVRRQAAVRVVMTRHAREFITPLTLETLSGNRVCTDLFAPEAPHEIDHIALARWADVLIVAPATANLIGKAAGGIADDLLTTTLLATRAPVLLCPAMNDAMWENPIVGENLDRLRRRGCAVVEPARGSLACGTEGAGRLADLSDILNAAEALFTPQDFSGETVLVTAGPTREPLDPVRFITNYSSGKMGYAIAHAARMRGASVILVSGPTALDPPGDVELVPVQSAREMRDAVLGRLEEATVVVKAAAVADYRPAVCADQKIKKQPGDLRLCLERNPDIIAEIGRKKGGRILVGFAMESENLLENARRKMRAKKMDLIVANDLTEAGAGFQGDTNVIRILSPDGRVEALPLMDKREAADRILDRIRDLRARGGR
jgi:phosphopantothenoylcysteine decarboxylase/phosphopantothenate--cysteine ligase